MAKSQDSWVLIFTPTTSSHDNKNGSGFTLLEFYFCARHYFKWVIDVGGVKSLSNKVNVLIISLTKIRQVNTFNLWLMSPKWHGLCRYENIPELNDFI